jgi:hypothetical protein
MKGVLTAWGCQLVLLVLVRQVWPDGILFYQGVALSALAAFGLLAWRMRATDARDGGESFKDALLVFLIAYSFMFTVPTTVDRSYSVRMLSMLDQSAEGLSVGELGERFNAYFADEGGVERRVGEQRASGTILLEGETVRLTPWGQFLTSVFRFNCVVFRCHH